MSLKQQRPTETTRIDVYTTSREAWRHLNLPRPAIVKVIGERWSARTHKFRALLDSYDAPYRFYEADSGEGQALLEEVQQAEGPFPVVIVDDGEARPS